jgi:Endopolygalacturonase
MQLQLKISKIIAIIIFTTVFTLLIPLSHVFTVAYNMRETPLSNKMAPHTFSSSPLNIKNFGGKGNGKTDDSASIQKAFDSIKDNGAIYFPKGIYIIKRTIMIPSYIRIVGESKRSTILFYQGTDKAFVSGDRSGKYGTGSYHISIEDVAFQGQDTGIGLYITSRYLTVNNVEISHFAVGIDAQYCWTNKFYNVSVFHNEIGFKGGSFLNANSFINCIFAAGQKAITFNQGWNIAFVGCQFEAYTDACFSFNEDTKDAIWNLSVNGCYFENSGKTIDAGPNCSFYGLGFNNNTITTHGTGLAINVDNGNSYGKNSGVVENNTFIRDNEGTVESFIHLNGPAYITFRANQCYATPDNASVQLLDEITRNANTTYIEEKIADGNRIINSGTGDFDKGVIIGANPPSTIDPGLIIYNNGKLKLYHDSSNSEILQTVKAGSRLERPGEPCLGMMYFDTTLNRPIWWNGKAWVDANGREKQ